MLRKIVEDCLRDNPKARDSDNELLINVLEKLGCHLSKDQQRIFRSMSFETVTRYRRKLQQQGEYLSSSKVDEFRFQNFVDARYTKGQSLFN